MSFSPLSPGARDALLTFEMIAKVIPSVAEAFRAIIGGHPEAERVRDIIGEESPVKQAMHDIREGGA